MIVLIILVAGVIGLAEGAALAQQGKFRELVVVSLVLMGATFLALLPFLDDTPPYIGPALTDLAKAFLKWLRIKPPI